MFALSKNDAECQTYDHSADQEAEWFAGFIVGNVRHGATPGRKGGDEETITRWGNQGNLAAWERACGNRQILHCFIRAIHTKCHVAILGSPVLGAGGWNHQP